MKVILIVGKFVLKACVGNIGHYTLYIDDFAISKRKTADEILIPYGMYNGTSMATPFVTAATGILSNIYENDTVLQRKNRVLACTRKSDGLDEKVVTGGVLDISRATKKISEINISHVPNKLFYIKGEELDLAGGKIEVTFEDGIKQDLGMTLDMISGYDKDNIGKQTLSVNYKEKTVTFTVTVIENIEKIILKQVPNKLRYVLGEKLDLTGGIIEVSYENGNKEEIEIEIHMISGYKKTSTGRQTLTVNLGGKTVTFDITVTNDITSINIKRLPNKLKYNIGEELDLTGGIIDVVFENGETKEENMTMNMVTGYDKNTLGEQILTITFKEQTNTFKVIVTNKSNNVTKIDITTLPTKTEYIKGEELDLSGIEITATYEDGTTEIIELSADKFTGYNANVIGSQTITVTYADGITDSFIINVLDTLNIKIDDYEVKNDDGITYIEKIMPNTSIETIINSIKTNGIIELYKNNLKLSDTSHLIETGMEIVIKLNKEEKRYIIVVMGDLTGNGAMGVGDLLRLSRYVAKLDTSLNGAYLRATDVVIDGKYAKISDILKMSRVLAKLDSL